MRNEDTGFANALARFKAADAAAADLATRLSDTRSKRVTAAMALAAIDREIADAATNSAVDLATAGRLVTRRTEAETLLSLMDRATDHIAQELTKAKAEVIAAELECAKAQEKGHSKALDDLCAEFVRNNTGLLQKATRAMYFASLFASVPNRGLAVAQNFASRHVESLAENVLPEVIAKAFANDERFRAGCVDAGKQASAQFYSSTSVSEAERAAARLRTDPAEVAAAIATANAVQEANAFDPAFAYQSARSAAQGAEQHHHRADEYKAKLRVRPGDQSIIASIKQHEAEAARFEQIVGHWDELLRQHAAA